MTALAWSAVLRPWRGRARPRWLLGSPTRGGLASIAAKTLALFVFVTVTPLVVALVQTRNNALVAEERALASASSVARAAADEVQESIRAAQRTGRILAGLPSFWEGADPDRDQVLAALVAPEPTFSSLVYFTDDFVTHGASNYSAAAGRPSVRSLAHAREVVGTGGSPWPPGRSARCRTAIRSCRSRSRCIRLRPVLEDRVAREVHPEVVARGLGVEGAGRRAVVRGRFPDLVRVDAHRVPQL